MKCKYKLFDNERFCQVINGECQFLTCQYGPLCPIYHEYINWDKYIVDQMAENDPDGVAHVRYIATEDMFDDSITTEAIVDVLDIIVDD